MADESYSSRDGLTSSLRSAATDAVPQSLNRRRRLPSPEEQKRRQEWGKKWGKLVSEAVREALGKSE